MIEKVNDVYIYISNSYTTLARSLRDMWRIKQPVRGCLETYSI